MNGPRVATCSCGQLRASAAGEPVRVSLCHCLACQRRTGSAFGAQARFPAGAVDFAGDHRPWVRVGEAGGRITHHFCPVCGSTVWYTVDAQPELVAIPLGAFADPGFPAPTSSVWEARMHGWVGLPADMVHRP